MICGAYAHCRVSATGKRHLIILLISPSNSKAAVSKFQYCYACSAAFHQTTFLLFKVKQHVAYHSCHAGYPAGKAYESEEWAGCEGSYCSHKCSPCILCNNPLAYMQNGKLCLLWEAYSYCRGRCANATTASGPTAGMRTLGTGMTKGRMRLRWEGTSDLSDIGAKHGGGKDEAYSFFAKIFDLAKEKDYYHRDITKLIRLFVIFIEKVPHVQNNADGHPLSFPSVAVQDDSYKEDMHDFFAVLVKFLKKINDHVTCALRVNALIATLRLLFQDEIFQKHFFLLVRDLVGFVEQ
eukprot:1151336-Pelagomonas_calceolata.AAC.2